MSRLSDLINQAKRENPQLGAEIEKEVRHLQERRSFGLNFERHQPEAVDLYGRPVRRGDKVRMLPPRGETKSPDDRLWIVTGAKTLNGKRIGLLRLNDRRSGEAAEYPIDDLVVVAESTDTIYPGLVSTGKIERGGDKPVHTVINSENLHALKLLLYTHRGKIDCIYIDPPYNTGARDWKYSNDYVEGDDIYRHSKWLAFMERRLRIARELLNPADSVMLVTIDEKEVFRLGLLIEQIFPGESVQMVTSIISPSGQPRAHQMSRVEEYIFIVYLGRARVGQDSPAEGPPQDGAPEVPVSWENLIRRGTSARRTDRENQFYPFFVDPQQRRIVSVGEPLLPASTPCSALVVPPGLEAVWPIRSDGSEGRWRISSAASRSLLDSGFIRLGRRNATTGQWAMNYVLRSDLARIAAGEIRVDGRRADGSAILTRLPGTSSVARTPKTVWAKDSHNAGNYGSALLRSLLPGRSFPFPKSLYAVEDALRLFVGTKPEATILDFFSGSGTTAHATMRLNHADGGRRQCISVTNNEISADEVTKFTRSGGRQGDEAWEALGICSHVTVPRIRSAISGVTPNGTSVPGSYKFVDEGPIALGLEESAEFFRLTYEAPLAVAANAEFARIAPILWLRAGASGRRIDSIEDGWDVADGYGVIADLDRVTDFTDALSAMEDSKIAFIVTDDERQFASICSQLPNRIEPVRLYESYLRNFQIDAARSGR